MRVLLALCVCLTTGTVFGLGAEHVLFYAPFDGSTGAVLARGNARANAADGLGYVPGIRGEAVVVGGMDPEAARAGIPGFGYETAGNLRREEGSVSLWVQALDWESPDGHNHQFVTIPGKGVTFYLYVFHPGNTWWLLLKKDGNRPVGRLGITWRPGEWHHLAATWREGEMALFVDGQESGREAENVPLPAELGERFSIGNLGQARTAFDELVIFDRALTPAEIAALHAWVAQPPPPATAVVGNAAGAPAHLAGLLDDITGQPVLDEEVTARLWADADVLHLTLRWAIPESFRANPTAYNGRALRRGSAAPADDDTFSVSCGPFHALIGPDGGPSARSRIDMTEWVVDLEIPRRALGGDVLPFRFGRHWRELRRLDATWNGVITIRPGNAAATVTLDDIRRAAAAVPDDQFTTLRVQVGDLYAACLPFVRAAPFQARLRHLRSREQIIVEVTDPAAVVTCGGETRSGAREHTFGTAELPLGEHAVRAVLGGCTKTLTFRRDPPPEWLTTKAGVSDEVPPPWSPLETDAAAGTVHCWGRALRWEGLFPGQITAQGQDLLAEPIRFQAGDQRSAGQSRITATAPAQVALEGSGTLGPADMAVRARVEYDGYTWFDVTLSPREAAAVELPNLALEIPMRPAHATLLNSGSYTCKDTGLIPPQGYRGDWRHRFWVGDETAGIQWFAEAPAGWTLAQDTPPLEVRDGLIRLTVSPGPVRLTAPLTLSFGLMATPVRPRPADWRSWRFGPDEVNRSGWRYVSLWNPGWSTLWNYPVLKPDTASRLQAKYAEGELPCLYANVTAISPAAPEFRDWYEDWRPIPSTRVDFTTVRQDDEQAHTEVCTASGFTDFFVWALERALREGDIRGLYCDVSHAPSCRNEVHGCGWRDAAGNLQPRKALRATRDFQKRVYTVAKRYRPDFLVAIHMSGDVFMPQHSFCDIMIDGENFTAVLQQQWAAKQRGDYYDLIGLDTMRAEFMLHNVGPVSAFLPEFARSLGPRWMTDEPAVVQAATHLAGLFALHDAPMWQAYMPGMVLRRVWYAQARFGWDSEVEFVPYWRSRETMTVSPDAPGVVASVFRRPGRAMIVAMNNTDAVVDLGLTWDTAALGLVGQSIATVEDFYGGGSWRLQDGVVPPIPLPARAFRMLVPLPKP